MSDKKPDSFVFYESFLLSIKAMRADKDKLATFLAVCDYALYGTEPKLDREAPAAAFAVIRPLLDTNKARRKNGGRGGRPRKGDNGSGKDADEHSDGNADASPGKTNGFEDGKTDGCANEETNGFEDAKPNVNVHDNGHVNAHAHAHAHGHDDMDNGHGLTAASRRGPSRPSSVGEVEEFARSIGSPASAQEWWDYFQERGWKVKGEPMTNWKSVFQSTHKWARFQRRSGQVRHEDYQPGAERIKANGDWLDEFLESLEEVEPAGEEGRT